MPVEAPLGLGLPAAPDPGGRSVSERGAVPPPAETGRAAVDPAVQAVVRAIAPDLNPMEGETGAFRFFTLGRDDPDTVTGQLEGAMDGGGVELAIILAPAATGARWARILSCCAALAWLPDREDTREPGQGLLIGGPAANPELVCGSPGPAGSYPWPPSGSPTTAWNPGASISGCSEWRRPRPTRPPPVSGAGVGGLGMDARHPLLPWHGIPGDRQWRGQQPPERGAT